MPLIGHNGRQRPACDRVTRLLTLAVEEGLLEAVRGLPLAGCVPPRWAPLDADTANPPPIAVKLLPSNWVPSHCEGVR